MVLPYIRRGLYACRVESRSAEDFTDLVAERYTTLPIGRAVLVVNP